MGARGLLTCNGPFNLLGANTLTPTWHVKYCTRCKIYSHDFGVARDRPDGLNGWCRSCCTSAMRRHRANRSATERRRDNLAFRRRYRENPAKWKAKVYVSRAVASGKLVKPFDCQRCGDNKRRLECHHGLGYDRANWLCVEWICRPCHALHHAAARSSAP